MKTLDVNHHILRTTIFAAILATALNTHAQEQPEQQLKPELKNQSILLRAIGGEPLGTHIGRLRHMDWSYNIASPIPFKHTYLTGFSYSERGGVLTQLFTILTLTAIDPEIGLSFAFEFPPEAIADFGVSIEYLTADRDLSGHQPFHFNLHFNHAIYLTGNPRLPEKLPITFTWGLQLKLWSLPQNIPTPQPDLHGSFGLPLQFAFPLTRWAQIDASFTLATTSTVFEIAAGTTFHLGNRFFLTAGSAYTFNQFGPFLRAGVRL